MTRTFVRRTLLVAAFTGAILSIGGMVSFSFFQSRSQDVATLDEGTAAWAGELADIFSEARASLSEIAPRLKGHSVQDVQKILRQLVFDKTVFREAGYIVNGRLLCTSYSLLEPPVQPSNEDYTRASRDGRIYFTPPSETLLGGPSLMIHYRVDDSAFVNLLIAPRTLTAPLRYIGMRGDFAQYLFRDDGELLIGSDEGRAVASPPPVLPALGLSYHGGAVYFRRPVADFGVSIVAVMPSGIVMKRWYDNVPMYGLLGLVIALLFLVGAWQLKSRLLGPDAELREAIATGQIEAFFQPVIDLQTGRCCGAEALARWRHPKRGLVPPALFVIAAEKSGLIGPLTLAVIESASRNIAATLHAHPDLRLNVNISSQSLEEPYFFTDFLNVIKGRILPSRFCFEITESTLMGPATLVAMRDFKRHGITLAVDDFGTGYSNLRYLKDFPFDSLKIDKAFVEGINSEGRSSGLVDHVVNIGKSCGLSLVAEGVETASQADYLRAVGVEYAQGYFYARPMSAPEFRDWLAGNLKQA